MTRDSSPFKREFQPIALKQLIVDCDIRQGDLASLTGLARATINVAINRGWLPPTIPNFQTIIEQHVAENKRATQWLIEKGLKVSDIWEPLGKALRKADPSGRAQRGNVTRKIRAIVSGDPEAIETNREVDMLRGETLKHFRLIRNPFTNDIRDLADIYMSDEHMYIEAAMCDAAKHGGFIAVIGEVGSGKSVIRKKVVAELSKDENTRIIYPRMIDKTRVTATSLCDAIIMDLSDEKPQMRLEQKTRQVEKLLLSRVKAGCRICLMIEEAHDLSVRILKLLKRFYEIEHGYQKAMGIILIGQPELGALFNEADHYDMREVIRRCQVAEIKGLNGNMRDYLILKFKRVGAGLENILTEQAIEALSKRLKDKDERGKVYSNAYPLTVNNYIIRAMNRAFEMGEEKVTEDVVMSI